MDPGGFTAREKYLVGSGLGLEDGVGGEVRGGEGRGEGTVDRIRWS